MNPWLKRQTNQFARGRIAEKKVAKRIGGRETINSGAMVGDKGDIDVNDFKIEVKSTAKDSFKLKLQELCKIANEAENKLLKPAFAVNFIHGDGEPVKNGAWVMVREQDFKNLFLGN